MGELRLPIPLKHNIVLQGIVQHKAVLVTVFRDMAHAHGIPCTNGHAGNVLAVKGDFAGNQGFQPCQAVDKLRLSVAVNAGDADNFAATHLQGYIPYGIVFVHLGGYRHVLNIQDHIPDGAILLVHMEFHVAPHHHGGKFRFRGILGLHRADALALAEHRAAVADGHDLLQLM